MDLVPKRKGQYRFRELLPNGQYMHLYFTRYRSNNENVSFEWQVTLVILDNPQRRSANLWFKKNKRARSTGDGSLTGMIRALYHILEFRSALNMNEEIFVAFEDQKRCRAYRWLLRHEFQECIQHDTDRMIGYVSRNPAIWEYVKEVNEHDNQVDEMEPRGN
ncbi:hypothetical protein [Bacillus suaedae]|uniref:Uncharacterized protein n=1 Tax=Halalkalibacter suaedae TaxID=2822140 RepID=A0A940WPL4_9BACI|nr:hypothetical protein [Bacillus suaedae]MBP3950329.1 hypothetical protein [Bacillus suaedae]